MATGIHRWEVTHRLKDVQYSSRVTNHITRQLETHRLQYIISQLTAKILEAQRNTAAVKVLAACDRLTQMHVVRLLAPSLPLEDHTKDVDFGPEGIRDRLRACGWCPQPTGELVLCASHDHNSGHML